MLFIFCETRSDGFEVENAIPTAAKKLELTDAADGILRQALQSKESVRGSQEIWADFARKIVFVEALAIGPDFRTIVLLTDRAIFR